MVKIAFGDRSRGGPCRPANTFSSIHRMLEIAFGNRSRGGLFASLPRPPVQLLFGYPEDGFTGWSKSPSATGVEPPQPSFLPMVEMPPSPPAPRGRRQGAPANLKPCTALKPEMRAGFPLLPTLRGVEKLSALLTDEGGYPPCSIVRRRQGAPANLKPCTELKPEMRASVPLLPTLRGVEKLSALLTDEGGLSSRLQKNTKKCCQTTALRHLFSTTNTLIQKLIHATKPAKMRALSVI